MWDGCDPRLAERAAALWRDEPWLGAAFPDPRSHAYWLWIVNFGLRQFPAAFETLLPPLPPRERMIAVSGSDARDAFLNAGTEAVERLGDVLRERGRDLAEVRQLLDFGCGCGRVIRHLEPYARMGVQITGCDVDDDAVRWCGEHLPFAHFVCNGFEPPLGFPAARFDVVCSFSVFTHLSATPQRRWAAELGRVAAPGATLAISVHGEHAWRKVVDDEAAWRALNVPPEDVAAARASWRTSGFAFLRQTPMAAAVDRAEYGIVFLQPGWIARHWPGLRVVDVRPGAISDWQDLVVLEATG